MTEPFEVNEVNCPHTFGQLLRDLRTNANLQMKVEDFCDYIGCTKSTLYRWESEGILPPRSQMVGIIGLIVEALGFGDRERLMLTRAWVCDLLKGAKVQKF